MNNENEIDDLFRQNLQKDYHYDENLWSKVESQLNSPKSGRGIWLTNLNTFLLSMILIAFAFIQTDNVKTNTTLIADAKLLNQEAEIFTLDGDAIHENLETKVNSVKQKIDKQTKPESDISQKQFDIPIDEQTKENEVREGQKSDYLNQSSRKKQKGVLLKEKVEQSKGIENITYLEKTFSAAAMQATESNITPNDPPLWPDLMPLSSLSYHIDRPNDRAIPGEVAEDKLDKLQEKFKKKFYFMEFSAERSFDIEKEISGLNPALRDFKEENEKSRHMESYGLDVFTDHKYFSLSYGIRISTYVEKVNYTVDMERNEYIASFDTNYVLVDEAYNNEGEPVKLVREEIETTYTPVTVIRQERVALRNEFRRLQMPLSIGFEKSLGRWNAGIRTGLTVNYLIMQSGVYIDEELNRLEGFNSVDRLNELTFSQNNEVNLGYKINELMVLGMHYAYQHDLNSFTKDYDSKFKTQSLGLWLRWRIRGNNLK